MSKKTYKQHSGTKMKTTTNHNRAEKGFAIGQMLILIIGIIAFSYAVGSEVKLVNAKDKKTPSVNYLGSLSAGTGALTFMEKFAGPLPIIKDLPKLPWAITKELTPAAVGTVTPPVDPTIPTDPSAPGYLEKILGNVFSPAASSTIATILTSAALAAAAYAAVSWVASALGAKPGMAKALASGAAAGVFALAAIPGVGWIAAGIGAIIAIFTWSDEKTETVVFTCNLWQPAPVKSSEQCEQCNDGAFPCSEYQCSSLGVSCEIVNKGTKDQKCIWVDRNDVDPPIMKPWQEALKVGYSYSKNNALSPPDRGVNVSYTASPDGCIPPYTPFSIGIQIYKNERDTTPTNAKCKADVARQANFSAMRIPLTGERYVKEHLITFSEPNADDMEAENIIPIGNLGNEHKLYIRCLSGNGIETNGNFEFSYCMQKGPDIYPPEIVETSITDGSPVRYGVGSLDLTVSANKPAQCRWSTLDRVYDDMENNMSCSTNVRQANAKQLYDCRTNLTGIKDRVDNTYYFRCNGTYNGQKSKVSYPLTLVGTQPLVIDEITPEEDELIKDARDPVKVMLTVKTSSGEDKQGGSQCYFSETGEERDYLLFYNTNSYVHSQELSLSQGDYTYSVKCVDAGANTDIENVSFRVETDTAAPAVVRAFHESSYLKIITNEEAKCVYDTKECLYEFDDGIAMTTTDGEEYSKGHHTPWNTLLNFYIKCRDEYGNQPAPDQCSMVVRPFTL